METLKLLYLAIGPGVAIAVYIYYSDKWEPEPKRMVIKGFMWGALAVFPTIFYEDAFVNLFGLQGAPDELWWQICFYAFFGVALAEELCKFFFLKEFIYESPHFSEPYDGIVYGAMVGCGFATMENIIYVLPLGYEVGILRMLTAVPGHAFDGIILGYFMGKAKFCPNPWKHLARGLGLVILLHGTYDSIAMSNLSWAIYPVFGVVIIGMYLGLKAKKELEKQSKLIEFSSKEFYLLEDKKMQSPLVLKDIRDLLSEGKLNLDDFLIIGKSGRKVSVKRAIGPQMSHEPSAGSTPPPKSPSPQHIFIYFGLTFGLYFYFWYYRVCREFNAYKKLKLDPELRTLILFASTLIPYLIYGAVLEDPQKLPWDDTANIHFNITMAFIETAFLFTLLKMVMKFSKSDRNTFLITFFSSLIFFALSTTRKLLPSEVPYHLWLQFILILLQGGILAGIQKVLNVYWKTERKSFTGAS